MHNELRSRNSLLKPFGFTTGGSNQLTIARAGSTAGLRIVFPIPIVAQQPSISSHRREDAGNPLIRTR